MELWLGVPYVLVGLIRGASAVTGFEDVSACRTAKGVAAAERAAIADEAARRARWDDEKQLRRLVREHAAALTREAATAARQGDCQTVQRLDSEVRDLDPEFHDIVFARDAAIAHCARR